MTGKGIFELEEFKAPEGDNVLVVDSLNLAFRYKHAKRTDFEVDYYNTVKSLAKSYSATKVIITCDYGKSSYRKEIYPDYKGDREAKVAQQTPEEKKDFEDFFAAYERAMAYCAESWPILKYKGVEADDIAAYLTHYVFKDIPENIWLISSDKDWDLLLRNNVHRFSYVTRKEYTLENWSEHYDYPHDILLDMKVLVGGKDNVTGIAGVGPKRAHTLLKEYGDAFNIYDSLPIPGKAMYIKNTNEFRLAHNLRNKGITNYHLRSKS